ncbi:four-carbon acid sugar kinase family protein [Lacrimispora sp. 210928-DFI.3.58]|uniref:four-carbon acid sugar kinase family protein n=1 Tax=Lacrimispora sp. 210928-DFI.3.58 TaxID=2883214 RepID=UPI0015B61AFD|nr:four-carbon acid sugar kinase family protein [Lacrimispora sp. 210928-DFI.3.58]MCB7320157.1 hydroxyacid dehydrogenase [Lacrimispora sp. 210928-DFI.3.58]
MEKCPVQVLTPGYRAEDRKEMEELLKERLCSLGRKIVVLDDDPTGIQTVSNVPVYTTWDKAAICQGFEDESPMFFLSTNSRSMTEAETSKAHLAIGADIAATARATGKDFLVISRSDSTLRGHYPLETQCLRYSIEKNSSLRFDGEIIMPFFEEGGRYTIGDIHYVREEENLIPVGETEFAGDKSFGFHSSDLKEWCQEKTGGSCKAEDVISISLEDLRNMELDKVTGQLLEARRFQRIIVNAAEYTDVSVFAVALIDAILQGKEFLFRTAASLLKVLCFGLRPSFSMESWLKEELRGRGGILIVGSHVNKTTRQLEYLKKRGLPIDFFEFNQHRILEDGGLEDEAKRVCRQASECIADGRMAAVYTRRERLDIPGGTPDMQLKMATEISAALTSVIGMLKVRPDFVIAKGGITSGDVMKKALKMKRGLAAGQAAPGIPIMKAGGESRFPGLPYVIFPGNVGPDTALADVIEYLMGIGRRIHK